MLNLDAGIRVGEVEISKQVWVSKVVQQVHGLNFEQLDRTLKRRDVPTKSHFIHWKIVLEDRVPLNKHDSTSTGVKGGQYIVLREMNGQLDDLLVEIFEGLMINLLKSVLQGDVHIVVIHTTGVCKGLNVSDVDEISVAGIFEEI
jgi:hypothetical protein